MEKSCFFPFSSFSKHLVGKNCKIVRVLLYAESNEQFALNTFFIKLLFLEISEGNSFLDTCILWENEAHGSRRGLRMLIRKLVQKSLCCEFYSTCACIPSSLSGLLSGPINDNEHGARAEDAP